MLTKAQILKADDLPTKVVKVPEWGGEVTVCTLTAHDKDVWEESITRDEGKVEMTNLRASLCALTIVGNDGKRIFSDQDVQALGEKSSLAMSRIYNVAADMNRVSGKDAEELVKNSGAIQSDDSS